MRLYLISCKKKSLNQGEEPLIKELKQLHEKGVFCSDEVVVFGTVYPLPAVSNQKISFLSAKNAYLKGPQNLDPFEYIQTQFLTHEELMAQLKSGAVVDGLLITALTLLSYNH